MQVRPCLAELLGTFLLTLAVWLSLAYVTPLATPVAAGLTLGLLVYTVGGVSGAHMNPAITLGLLSARLIAPSLAICYIVAQLAGGMLAMATGWMLTGGLLSPDVTSTGLTLAGEALGAFILAFSVTSVARHSVAPAAAGLTVGGGLLLGIHVAASFSSGILNPAVALGLGSVGGAYAVGPVVGALLGCWVRSYLEGSRKA